ncbi:Peptide deformylase 1A [Spatholobus suberectus]|nr:Peptide deformylase 1A [Spatholobus suberectus]
MWATSGPVQLNSQLGVVGGEDLCNNLQKSKQKARKKRVMVALHLRRVLAVPVAPNSLFVRSTATQLSTIGIARPPLCWRSASSQRGTARAGWFVGLGAHNKKTNLPDTVKAGDPVLPRTGPGS